MSEAKSAESAPASTAGSALTGAADRLREAARWLVLTFGAVVAVVFAGISISRFGDIDPDTAPAQFWLAVAGAAVALIGALWALLISMSLAAASTVSVSDLVPVSVSKWRTRFPDRSLESARTTLQSDPLLKPWEGNFTDFFAEVGSAQLDFEGQLKAWRGQPEIDATDEWVQRASQRLTHLGQMQASILGIASYLRLQHRFSRARWWLGVALLIATSGAATFVWATGTPASEGVPERATSGVWTVPSGSQDAVREQLGGTACGYDLAQVPVTILGQQGDGKEQDIVTVASDDCRPVRIVVSTKEVTAAP